MFLGRVRVKLVLKVVVQSNTIISLPGILGKPGLQPGLRHFGKAWHYTLGKPDWQASSRRTVQIEATQIKHIIKTMNMLEDSAI